MFFRLSYNDEMRIMLGNLVIRLASSFNRTTRRLPHDVTISIEYPNDYVDAAVEVT